MGAAGQFQSLVSKSSRYLHGFFSFWGVTSTNKSLCIYHSTILALCASLVLVHLVLVHSTVVCGVCMCVCVCVCQCSACFGVCVFFCVWVCACVVLLCVLFVMFGCGDVWCCVYMTDLRFVCFVCCLCNVHYLSKFNFRCWPLHVFRGLSMENKQSSWWPTVVQTQRHLLLNQQARRVCLVLESIPETLVHTLSLVPGRFLECFL